MGHSIQLISQFSKKLEVVFLESRSVFTSWSVPTWEGVNCASDGVRNGMRTVSAERHVHSGCDVLRLHVCATANLVRKLALWLKCCHEIPLPKLDVMDSDGEQRCIDLDVRQDTRLLRITDTLLGRGNTRLRKHRRQLPSTLPSTSTVFTAYCLLLTSSFPPPPPHRHPARCSVSL